MLTQSTETAADQKDWNQFECDSDNCEERVARRKMRRDLATSDFSLEPEKVAALNGAMADIERAFGKWDPVSRRHVRTTVAVARAA